MTTLPARATTPVMLTTDLKMLVASGLLTLLLAFLPQISRIGKPGFRQWNAGNRETPFETPAWGQRAARAHANLLENLCVFAIAVLVVHVRAQRRRQQQQRRPEQHRQRDEPNA